MKKKPRANRFIPENPDALTGADLAAVLGMLCAAFALSIVFI